MPDYIYHTGDTDTYFGFTDANIFKIQTGDDGLMYIKNGNIGIGTTAPRCTLNTHNTIGSGDSTIPQYTGDIDGNKSCDLFLGKSADSGDNYWGMWMGTPYESPWGSYIQCGCHDDHYPLNLNPHGGIVNIGTGGICLLYTSTSPRDS